jgi:hypothetical protein
MAIKTSKAVTIDPTRLEAVRHAVAQGFTRAAGVDYVVDDAKDALDTAKDERTTERESIMQTLASAAHTNEWTEDEINAGIAAYVASRNDSKLPSSLNTLKSQITTAMHPNVRDDFTRIQSTVNDAWETETAAIEASKGTDTKADTPLRKLHKRKYHMLVTIMVAAKGDKDTPEGTRFYTTGELVAHARANDPDDNAEKLLKRVASIIKSLQDIQGLVTDVEDLDAAVDMLGRITETEMANGRCDKLGIPRPVVTSAQPKAVKVTTVVNPTVTPVAAPVPVVAAPVAPTPLADNAIDAMEALLSSAA